MLTRRQLLARGAVSAAAWQLTRQPSALAAGVPTRLIIMPLLNGSEARYFWPSPGNLAAMSMITEPLKEYQRQITFIKGLNVDGSMNHMAVRSIFSGATIPDYLSPDPSNKSVDQVFADHVAASAATKLRSLHLGAIPADSIDYYQRYGRSTFFFAPRPVDYEANPVSAFDRTFRGLTGTPKPVTPGTPTPGAPSPPTDPSNFDAEVLNIADAELSEIGKKLGASPREMAKLDQHRQALRGLRAAIPTGTGPLPGMMTGPMDPPAADPMGGKATCDTSAMASVEKLRATLQGKDALAYRHQYFSDIFDAQIDIAVRAVACGITRIATIQAGSADGNVTDPVGPGYPHHNTSHGNQDIFAQCQRWYASKFFRLLKGLDVPDPLDPSGKTVLYNSVVLMMSECNPVGHDSNSIPVLVAGNGGGGMKAGALIDVAGGTNKALMQTILQILGVSSGGGHFGSTTFSGLRA